MKTPAFKISRRRFIGGVSLAAAGTFGYAHFFEAEWLQKSFIAVPLSGGSKPPVKLLHLSDLHASSVVRLSYIEHMQNLMETFRKGLNETGISYTAVRTSDPFDHALWAYLQQRVRLGK